MAVICLSLFNQAQKSSNPEIDGFFTSILLQPLSKPTQSRKGQKLVLASLSHLLFSRLLCQGVHSQYRGYVVSSRCFLLVWENYLFALLFSPLLYSDGVGVFDTLKTFSFFKIVSC